MITDRLDAAGTYSLGGLFAQALDYLREADLEGMPDGRYAIDGERLYVMLQSYTTRGESECRFETHRRYADIQLLLRGREDVDWAPAAALPADGAYSAEKDVQFHTGSAVSVIGLEPGLFAVFFPQDGHRPCRAHAAPVEVRKAVVKILLS